MFTRLFLNEWKETFRSPYLSQSIAQKIFIGLFAIYIALNFLVLGFFFHEIIEKVFPKADVFEKSSVLFFYYFLLDILMRFFVQTFPVLSIRPYLSLPIKKSSLIHFLLLKSIPSVFNILPLLIVVPFFINLVLPTFGFLSAIAWLISIVAIILSVHFLSFYIKKNFTLKPSWTFVLLIIIGLVFYADLKEFINVSAGMTWLMNKIVTFPLLAIAPVLFFGGIYSVLYNYFRGHLYLDSVNDEQQEVSAGDMDFALFNRFGSVGDLLQMESKLIWRNKRSRGFVYMSIAFLAFPFILIFDPEAYGDSTTLLVCVMVTGMCAFNYAQLMLSWHTTHFDYLLTRKITLKEILKSKYYFMALMVFVFYLATLPFGFFVEGFFLTNTAAMLFNIGFSIFIYMFIAVYYSKKVDAVKGGAFSFEGFGAAHYLVMVPIIGIPVFIFMAFNLFNLPNWGIIIIGVFGLIGILLQEFILNSLVKELKEEKYKIGAEFRN
ncbi:MAG: DUF5687 family protein [Saprospiraceae bacterium]